MSEPFLAEIRMVGFNFAPRGWAFCDGQILPINQNQSLYSLLGTTYGGDGRTSFALPDMRGRTPMHTGEGHVQGKKGGTETETLEVNEIPQHTHTLRASSSEGVSNVPPNNLLAREVGGLYESDALASNLVSMVSGTLANAGGAQGHENMQPFMALNFVIALQGLFPSRN